MRNVHSGYLFNSKLFMLMDNYQQKGADTPKWKKLKNNLFQFWTIFSVYLPSQLFLARTNICAHLQSLST